jgi:hypothetical protein
LKAFALEHSTRWTSPSTAACVAFALAVSILSGIMFGLIPAPARGRPLSGMLAGARGGSTAAIGSARATGW